MSDNAASATTELGPHESVAQLQLVLSNTLAALARRPVQAEVRELKLEQVAAVCDLFGLSPAKVAHLSVVATRRGPKLVVWAHV